MLYLELQGKTSSFIDKGRFQFKKDWNDRKFGSHFRYTATELIMYLTHEAKL